MAKRKKTLVQSDDGLITIRVGSAGIGRMGFKAWIDKADVIDRQDGDDTGVCDTPGQALHALADRIDAECAAAGFRVWGRVWECAAAGFRAWGRV
jgi:hypothetical protein